MKKAKKEGVKIIQITEADGAVKKIGKYNSNTKVFSCTRKRSEHFMRKLNSWGLDSVVVNFLIQEEAIIRLKDSESKWEYECDPKDFKIYGTLEEFHQHRPQYFLPLDYWKVIVAKGRANVIECKEESCRFNFGKNCLAGIIKINEKGECDNYEE